MIEVLRAEQRGRTRTAWLESRHSFSFGSYRNPDRMGFRDLRVINDDVVDPGAGFDEHSHRDMEIISYVVEGGLQHADSLGSGGVIRPGDVQLMSAGKGIRHSEFNASDTEPVRFLQIWIPPRERGLEPGYAQQRFPISDDTGKLHLVVDPDGRDGALKIHQDARLYAGRFDGDQHATLELDSRRYAWVQVVRGSLELNGQPMSEGDGAAISEEQTLQIANGVAAEILVFDLA